MRTLSAHVRANSVLSLSVVDRCPACGVRGMISSINYRWFSKLHVEVCYLHSNAFELVQPHTGQPRSVVSKLRRHQALLEFGCLLWSCQFTGGATCYASALLYRGRCSAAGAIVNLHCPCDMTNHVVPMTSHVLLLLFYCSTFRRRCD